MKLLLAGDWHSELHEKVLSEALRSLGHEVVEFKWHEYFISQGLGRLRKASLRTQNKFMIGPQVRKLNQDLLIQVSKDRFDAVFVYRGSHVYAQTLARAKALSPNTIFIGYNNDDPFSKAYPPWLWRHFVKSIPLYDLVLAYREVNVNDFRRSGARRVELFRSWYVPSRNRPVELTDSQRQEFGCDAVFVGHLENDGRLECVERLVAEGINLRLYGPPYEWVVPLKRAGMEQLASRVKLVWGEDYNLALAGAKIALCFLSKMNRDTYTRRCFEIPASGTLLLAERTPDLESLFIEGVEAVFFDSEEDLLHKLESLLLNPSVIERISQAGLARVERDGHDVVSRAKLLLSWIDGIKEEVA